MATYNKEYQYSPQKRRKQKYSMIQRVIDFSVAPVVSGQLNETGYATKAWAIGDVLQAIKIKPNSSFLIAFATASANRNSQSVPGCNGPEVVIPLISTYGFFFVSTTSFAIISLQCIVLMSSMLSHLLVRFFNALV